MCATEIRLHHGLAHDAGLRDVQNVTLKTSVFGRRAAKVFVWVCATCWCSFHVYYCASAPTQPHKPLFGRMAEAMIAQTPSSSQTTRRESSSASRFSARRPESVSSVSFCALLILLGWCCTRIHGSLSVECFRNRGIVFRLVKLLQNRFREVQKKTIPEFDQKTKGISPSVIRLRTGSRSRSLFECVSSAGAGGGRRSNDRHVDC